MTHPIPTPPPQRREYTSSRPHAMCPVHGDQPVVGISGDLLTVTLGCGATFTAEGVSHE